MFTITNVPVLHAASGTGWSPLIIGHALAATLALILGAVQLLRRHFGDSLHRWNGRIWVGLMYFVVVSSFWIQDIRPGHFSWIHILSVVTVVSLTFALIAIRRGDIPGHAISMISTYVGMIGALIGVIAVPTRLVPRSFQSNWFGMTLLAAGIAIITLLGILLLSFAVREIDKRRV